MKGTQFYGCSVVRTDPQVVHSYADFAVLFWDVLFKVLIEAGLYWANPWDRWPVVNPLCQKPSIQAYYN